MLRMDASLCRGLVDADTFDGRKVHARDRRLDIVEDDAPKTLVGDLEKARRDRNRHVHGERHGEAFEQQREAGVRACRPCAAWLRHDGTVTRCTPHLVQVTLGVRAVRNA